MLDSNLPIIIVLIYYRSLVLLFVLFLIFVFFFTRSLYLLCVLLALSVREKNEEFVFSSVSLLGSFFSVVSREYYYFYYYYHHLHAFNIVYCFLTSSHYLNTHLLRFITNFTIANLKDKDSKIDKK